MGAGNPYAPPIRTLNKLSAAPGTTANRGKGEVATGVAAPASGRPDTTATNGRPALASNQSYVMGRGEGSLIKTSTINPEYVAWQQAQQESQQAATATQPTTPTQVAAGKVASNERLAAALRSGGRNRILTSAQGLFNTSQGRKTLLGQ